VAAQAIASVPQTRVIRFMCPNVLRPMGTEGYARWKGG
jgi:hypothetical protein